MSDLPGLFVSAHTHWDREWYKSFEVFRVRFAEMMDSLLNHLEKNPDFPPFTIDGQAIVLSDYLEIRPQKKELLKKHVERGALLPGPWLVQPDLFLSSGEEIVRNLQEGLSVCGSLGGSLHTLYIPESGGIISQTPQIMDQFDMLHLVFIRGIGNEILSPVYRICGSDGTEVIATYLVNAYNNGGLLPEDTKEALERVRREVENLKEYKAGPWALLNQGGDHLPAQEFLPRIIKALQESGEYAEVAFGGYDDYFNRIKDLPKIGKAPVIRGELRGSRTYPVLYGKNTSRMDFKLKSSAMRNRLIFTAEPLAVMEMLTGRPYPEVLLGRVWNLLLQNQHHNTISGTVTDGVMDEAKLRLQKAADLLREEWNSAGRFFTLRDENLQASGGRALSVINTHPRKRSGPVTASVSIYREPGDGISVFDGKGEPVSHQIVASGGVNAPMEILIWAEDVPGLSCRNYTVKTGAGAETTQELSPIISNGMLEAGFEPEGTFYLKDLRTKTCLNGLNRFWDEADGGDLYNFSPIPGDITLSHILKDPRMGVVESGPLRKSLQLTGELYLPGGLEHDRRRRRSDYVSCPVNLKISIYRDLPLLECNLSIENTATDHRLRMVFPTGILQGEVLAGQPFDLVRREVSPPAHSDWIETPSGAGPFSGIAALTGKESSLAVFSDGIREYEIASSTGGHMICLTLLRSVGWLSRGDCITRRVTVAPQMETSGAQVQGKLSFSYALCPFGGKEDLPAVLELYQNCRNPLMGAGFMAGLASRPLSGGLMLNPGSLVVSALRKSQQGDNVILRFYNPLDETVQGELISSGPLKQCRKTCLSECTGEAFANLPFRFPVRPKEIVTLELSR